MPKVQQTFTLIDPTVGMQKLVDRRADQALPELAPWMTSKQAQKLHRERTRQPKVSREEQRRLEREEQARIKAEFEKEKASKRARFLRDKKKEKEQKALEQRRKKGLPLVDVRPSQSTISWFVRPGGATKRKVDDVEGAAQEQIAPRPHPSQRQQEQTCENMPPAPIHAPSPAPIAPVAPTIFSPTATLLPTSSQLRPLRDMTNFATPAPPPSTQFVMDHVEDFFPTPSQMDRELEEEYGTPMAVAKPAPATIASRPRPPVPLFCDSGNGNIAHSPSRVLKPLAPMPAASSTSKLVSRVKSVADYFATQDWELSSQDIRDLEGTNDTPCKSSKAVPPVITAQAPVITSEVAQKMCEEDPANAFDAPLVSTREARRRSPEDFAPLHESSESIWDSESQPCSPVPPEPSLPKLWPRVNPPSPAVASESPKQASATKNGPPKTSSPIRFFGSSGNGVELLMALVESRKLAAEEEAKRKQAERRRLAEERLAEERFAYEKQKQLQKQAESRTEEIARDIVLSLSQCSIQNDDTEEPASVDQSPLQPEVGAEGTAHVSGMAVAASEAETDYGDDDFADLEEETLTLLDAVAPTTTTTAAAYVAAPQVTVRNGSGGGNAADYTASFDLNDDSWLADDAELAAALTTTAAANGVAQKVAAQSGLATKELSFCGAGKAAADTVAPQTIAQGGPAPYTVSFDLDDDSWLSDDDTLAL